MEENGVMKATGIVRRIDDLGRVVIPKEIRKTLRIREGDPLEIFTNEEGGIVLKKFSPVGELKNFAKEYAESMAQTTGHMVCIVDHDQIVAIAGGAKKDLLQKQISRELEDTIHNRENVVAEINDKNYRKITDSDEDYQAEAIAPIISEGDAIGSVIMLEKNPRNKMGVLEQKLSQTAAGFLGRQMEG